MISSYELSEDITIKENTHFTELNFEIQCNTHFTELNFEIQYEVCCLLV